jgi:hypothetical protein
MIDEPAATAVTTPEELTVATAVLAEVQVTLLFVAFEGVMVAVSAVVEPRLMLTAVGETDTPVTATFVLVTAIWLVAVKPPLTVFTVMVAAPTLIPVTTPAALTVATVVLLEVHVTLLFEALDGVTIAVRVVVAPCAMLTLAGETDTPVTGILFPPVGSLPLTNVPSAYNGMF